VAEHPLKELSESQDSKLRVLSAYVEPLVARRPPWIASA